MNVRSSILKCALAGAVVVLSSGVSNAATLVAETNKSVWDGAVINQNILDFDTNLPTDGYTVVPLNTLYQFPTYSVRLNGMTFTNIITNGGGGTSNGYLQVSGWNSWGTNDYMRGQPVTSDQSGTIHILFPVGGITAFGVRWVTGGGYGTLEIKTGADTTGQMTTPSATMGFYGLTFATPVSYIDLNYTNNPNIAAFDNIIMATAKTTDQTPPPSDTPEAATMIMCATGLVFLSKKIARRTSV